MPKNGFLFFRWWHSSVDNIKQRNTPAVVLLRIHWWGWSSFSLICSFIIGHSLPSSVVCYCCVWGSLGPPLHHRIMLSSSSGGAVASPAGVDPIDKIIIYTKSIGKLAEFLRPKRSPQANTRHLLDSRRCRWPIVWHRNVMQQLLGRGSELVQILSKAHTIINLEFYWFLAIPWHIPGDRSAALVWRSDVSSGLGVRCVRIPSVHGVQDHKTARQQCS